MKFQTAFVTGSTGLLGNNLVRLLAGNGVRVRALARSREKAKSQFRDVPGVEIIEGDLLDVAGFEGFLAGNDVLFHTAAHFRDSYKGGNHRKRLQAVNVAGTRELLGAAHRQGISRIVHTSSVAVLDGPLGALVNETMLRRPEDADDYQQSKIEAEREVLAFLAAHSDAWACLVLPGWMHGPGDMGPTSAGQVTLDFLHGRLPGIIPASFSVVDARDVAATMEAAATKGRSGERYLAAGRYLSMEEMMPLLGEASGLQGPARKVPLPLLWVLAGASELYARLSGRPVLLSLATVRLITREAGRSHFDPAKTERELGVTFRPITETLADEVTWYRANGWAPAAGSRA